MNIINRYENNNKNLKKEIDLNTQKIKQLITVRVDLLRTEGIIDNDWTKIGNVHR